MFILECKDKKGKTYYCDCKATAEEKNLEIIKKHKLYKQEKGVEPDWQKLFKYGLNHVKENLTERQKPFFSHVKYKKAFQSFRSYWTVNDFKRGKKPVLDWEATIRNNPFLKGNKLLDFNKNSKKTNNSPFM